MTPNIIARFDQKYVIDATTGCWNWTACRNKAGYGYFGFEGKPMLAHRFSAMVNGLDMTQPNIYHKCSNPSCVNPDHLIAGSVQDTIDNMAVAGTRATALNGGIGQATPLTADSVRQIRALYATGNYTQKQLAAKFNSNQPSISEVIRCKKFKYVV